MNKSREALDAYYREAGSWADDQAETLRSSRKTAWITAIAAGTIAVLEAIAIVVMMPFKTVEPYTLMVDKTTGYVQELKPIDAQKISPDTALTQSFLVQYVIARESYDYSTIGAQYKKVVLWSKGTAQTDYKNSIIDSNPASPLKLLDGASIDTRVVSVSSPSAGTATVRFETIRRDKGGQPQPPQSWVATLKYAFSTGPMSSSDRYINPLGFQVSNYNRDQEALSPAAPAYGTAPPPPVNAIPQIGPGQPGAPGATPAPTVAPRPAPQPEVVL